MTAVRATRPDWDPRLPALVDAMTVSGGVQRRYYGEATRFLSSAPRRRASVSLRASRIFRQQFVVVMVDDQWLADIAPGCDAIAADRVRGDLSRRPPAVMLPRSRRLRRGRKFQSVLEHEYVHVNQCLLGIFPDCGTNEASALGEFTARVACEHAAYFIQRIHFAEPVPRNFTVDTWLALRAVSEATERFLVRVMDLDITPASAVDMMQSARATLLEGTVADDLSRTWIREQFGGLVSRATRVVATWPRRSSANPVLRRVAAWAGPPGVSPPLR